MWLRVVHYLHVAGGLLLLVMQSVGVRMGDAGMKRRIIDAETGV
jgi:hypothetical protein